MVKLTMKAGVDEEKHPEICLGYKEIKLLFNCGQFPGGGDCIFAEMDGTVGYLNSGDIIEDLDFYDLSRE